MISRASLGTAIAAVHEVAPGRYPQFTPSALQEFILGEFLRHCRVPREVVDGVLVSPPGTSNGEPDVFAHERVTDALGLTPRFAETMSCGGATYALMVARASLAIAAGQANAVLCLGGGKFPAVAAGGGDKLAKITSHPDFEYPYGSFIPAMYALCATRHMHERGTPREALAQVAVTSRAWSLRHPQALMRAKGPITIDDVLRSRPIASPFNLLDCSVPCEGGAAMLVARTEIAQQITAQPAHVLGFGEFHDHGAVAHASDFATMGAGVSARAAFAMAGLAPADVRLAELYDAFSINPILLLEETGLALPGRGGHHFLDGRAAPGGSLPVNTFGGLLSFGHTGDASGFSMLVEGARQVMGLAEGRQVDAGITLVHTYGGMMADHCTLLLGREP